jgi:Zn-finger nucleic acid-binding protein
MSGYAPLGPLGCPVCRVPLVELSVGDGTGGGCQRCAGIWVDEVGLAAVRERLFATILERSGPRAAPPRESTPLACPICQKAMLVTEVASAVIDVCPGHGTWFDPGELETLAHAIAVARNQAAIGRAPDAPVSVMPSSSADVRRIVDNLNDQLRRSVDRVESLVEMERLRRDMVRRQRDGW